MNQLVYKGVEISQTITNGDFSTVTSPVSIIMYSVIIVLGLGWFFKMAIDRLAVGGPAGVAMSRKDFIKGVVAISSLAIIAILHFIYSGLTSGTVGFGNAARSSSISDNFPQTPSTPATRAPVASRSCSDPSVVISQLQTSGVCANTVCRSSVGCKLTPWRDIIIEESGKAGVSASVIGALLCRESGGVNQTGKLAQNGKQDCGLMQINRASCDASIMDPRTNIKEGIRLYKQNASAVSSFSYGGGITKDMMVFASYNCCGTEGSPNAKSVSCNPATGFNSPIPKWACPIDPGTSQFNMCAVKNYACDVAACANDPNIRGLFPN